jgi:hypothetical protein
MPRMAGFKSLWLKTARKLSGRVSVQVWSLLNSAARGALSVHLLPVIRNLLVSLALPIRCGVSFVVWRVGLQALFVRGGLGSEKQYR